MVNHPRNNRARNKSGRSLIRDRDRASNVTNPSKVLSLKSYNFLIHLKKKKNLIFMQRLFLGQMRHTYR